MPPRRRTIADDDEDADYEDDGGGDADASAAGANPAALAAADAPALQKSSRSAFVARISAHPACGAAADLPHDALSGLAPGVVLRDYQLKGVQWMAHLYKCGTGGILGLGKTLQSIAFLVHLRTSPSRPGPFLVVAPLSVIDGWIGELHRFAGLTLTPIAYPLPLTETPQKVKFDVLVTTYEIADKDSDFLGTFSWEILVADEAHRLKSPDSVQRAAIEDITGSARARFLLTGTPVQNNLAELGSLLHLACPKVFNENPDGGIARLFTPSNGTQAAVSEKKALMDDLADLIRPFMLRRNKEDVLDLPPIKETIMLAQYTKARSDPSVAVLMQLRKCSNHPYIFDGVEPEPFVAGEHLVNVSGKMMLIDRILRHLRTKNKRVLIFSQMTAMLDIIQDYLTYRGFDYERLDGSVRGEERNLAVKRFSSAGPASAFVFLLSTRAGGVGLNLTAADTVIFVDSDFNPTADQQAAKRNERKLQARVHRIGQTQSVSILRLVTEGSVDEVILKRARAKLSLGKRLLQTNDTSGLDRDDSKPSTPQDLVAIIKFGLHRIISGDGDDDNDKGDEKNGVEAAEAVAKADAVVEEWIRDLAGKAPESATLGDDAIEQSLNVEDMYDYDGLNYRGADKDDEAMQSLAVTATKSGPVDPAISMARAAAREATRERALQRKLDLAQKKEERKLARWADAGYVSMAVGDDEDVEDDTGESTVAPQAGVGDSLDESAGLWPDDDEDPAASNWSLLTGSVTEPRLTPGQAGIIIQVVDDSGSWPDRGVFAALHALDPAIQAQYALAGEMGDLASGSVHLFPVHTPDDNDSAAATSDLYVALLVAQRRPRSDDSVPGPVRMQDLETGLEKIARVALRIGASVHLPRIGQATPGFDWYRAERAIRHRLPARGIPTCLYYFRRRTSASFHSDAASSSLHHHRSGLESPARRNSLADDDMPGSFDDDRRSGLARPPPTAYQRRRSSGVSFSEVAPSGSASSAHSLKRRASSHREARDDDSASTSVDESVRDNTDDDRPAAKRRPRSAEDSTPGTSSAADAAALARTLGFRDPLLPDLLTGHCVAVIAPEPAAAAADAPSSAAASTAASVARRVIAYGGRLARSPADRRATILVDLTSAGAATDAATPPPLPGAPLPAPPATISLARFADWLSAGARRSRRRSDMGTLGDEAD
ncbi:Chromodomain-helicase-DNA-binding protein 1-like [Cladochytrium tenue]|nr:Chromodomain-helicase-DNA-binding protein 1-like [Cladochytrium tenue]